MAHHPKAEQAVAGKQKHLPEKIQKVVARSGHGSRREVERWIADGRMTINGDVAELGARVGPKDEVALDGRRLFLLFEKQPPQVIAYHKPEGEVVTRDDPDGRTTVFAQLPKLKTGRWINVGRLDVNTSGLLLFTNDGELANRLMHPSYSVEREYAVRVLGEVSEQDIQQLLDGVQLEDGSAHFTQIKDAGGSGANHWFHVVIKEGRHREVRRLWEAIGFTVSRLIRIRFDQIKLNPRLRPGKSEELLAADMRALYEKVALEYPEAKSTASPLKKGKGHRRSPKGKQRLQMPRETQRRKMPRTKAPNYKKRSTR